MSEAPPPVTALVVDDEAYFRRFVGQVLKSGLVTNVLEARDGREGLQMFQEHQPGLVLLDINMPHLDGLATLKALRQLSATVPIIMLTSVSEEMVVEESVGHGASFFIRKDVPAGQLAAALREVLEGFLKPQEPGP